MSPIKLHPEEKLIVSDQCLYHRGPIAYNGNLMLTSQRLCFIPEGILDRLVGAKPFFIPLKEIESVSITGIDKFLTIRTTQNFRFSGTGALRIKPRLEVHWRASLGNPLSLKDVDILNEQVILQGVNTKVNPISTNNMPPKTKGC